VPTAVESGLKDFEVSAWFGIFAPAGTPAAIVDRLNADITAVLQLPEMQKRLRELGADPETGTPESYSRYVRSEARKWAEVVKKAGLSP
jgi:tripartite-type tricarboxylate transporter receptor subunit TctC